MNIDVQVASKQISDVGCGQRDIRQVASQATIFKCPIGTIAEIEDDRTVNSNSTLMDVRVCEISRRDAFDKYIQVESICRAVVNHLDRTARCRASRSDFLST